MQSIPKIVFAAEMGHFDEDSLDFNLGLLPFSLRMAYIQYNQKCQDFSDNGGDNKLCFMQSIPKIVFAAEMGHFDEDSLDFNLGLLPLSLRMAYIQYHLKCQDFTVNGGDNKL